MKTYKWTVEFEVDETWVADGFNLTDERAKHMLSYDLQFADGSEINAKVIKAPAPLEIAKAQGYENATHILEEIEQGKL